MADRRDEDPVDTLLSDLERQAEGLHLTDRESELAELATAQYAEVPLAARLYAAVGSELRVRLAGDADAVLEGTVEDAGLGWFALTRAGMTWIVATAGVLELAGLVREAVPDTARPAASRLSIRAALRPHAEERIVLRLLAGGVREGRLIRVGADFVELRPEGASTVVLPLGAIAAAMVRT